MINKAKRICYLISVLIFFASCASVNNNQKTEANLSKTKLDDIIVTRDDIFKAYEKAETFSIDGSSITELQAIQYFREKARESGFDAVIDVHKRIEDFENLKETLQKYNLEFHPEEIPLVNYYFGEAIKYIRPNVKKGVYGVIRIVHKGAWTRINRYPYRKDETLGEILPNCSIKVVKFLGKNQEPGPIINETNSDKNGFYQIKLKKGTYILVINSTDAKNHLSGTRTTYETIAIEGSGLIEKNIMIVISDLF